MALKDKDVEREQGRGCLAALWAAAGVPTALPERDNGPEPTWNESGRAGPFQSIPD